MNEIVSRLMQQANLSEEQAQQAATVVSNYLNERLPAQLQGPVNAALSGKHLQSAADSAQGLLGGMAGEKER